MSNRLTHAHAGRNLLRVIFAAGLLLLTGIGFAASQAADEKAEFTDAFLNDENNVQIGKELWQKQCRHCHGASAYPGKAPKLKPRKYTPDFVYDRIANGFRKMPPWKSVYSTDQIKAITAFVKHRSFSP